MRLNTTDTMLRQANLVRLLSEEIERRRGGKWFDILTYGRLTAYCQGRAEGGQSAVERRAWTELAKLSDEVEKTSASVRWFDEMKARALEEKDFTVFPSLRKGLQELAERLPELERRLGVIQGTRSEWTYWAAPDRLMTPEEVEREVGADAARAWRAELAWRAAQVSA